MRSGVVAALALLVLAGCGMGPEYTAAPPGYSAPPQGAAVMPTAAAQANPAFLPLADPQCVWETVVDVVDDYFRIEHEEPVRLIGSTLTEGTLTTIPQVSPTVFEPWRRDTVDPEQRTENTLQTMRRRAVVRVIPAQGGHWVDVQVFKELENLARPENATAGSATFRYDSTLTGVINPITGEQSTQGWIAKGRDTAMEQHIIGHLLSRTGQAASPMVVRGQDR